MTKKPPDNQAVMWSIGDYPAIEMPHRKTKSFVTINNLKNFLHLEKSFY